MIGVHTVKLVKDPIRREPQNVGVIAARPNGDGTNEVASRFIGQKPDGTLSGRPIGVPKDLYERWAEYFVSKLRAGLVQDIDRLMAARPTSFYLDHVVTLFDENDPDATVARMYHDLITERPQDARSEFDAQIESLLSRAAIVPQRDVSVRGDLLGDEIDVNFGYAFENGQLHLMDKVVASPKVQSARKNANDFAWRAHVVSEAHTASSFVAFVDLSDAPGTYIDNELRPVFKIAHVADVSRPDESLDMLRSLVRH